MNNTQKDLLNVSYAKKLTSAQSIMDYLRSYRKYDNLTFRQIDEVVAQVKRFPRLNVKQCEHKETNVHIGKERIETCIKCGKVAECL